MGDIAGMGADLFGSFAEATCAALVVASVSELGASHDWSAMMFPLFITAAGIIVSLFTTLIATDISPARSIPTIESTLKLQLIVSTLLMTPVVLLLAFVTLPATFDMPYPGDRVLAVKWCATPPARCQLRMHRSTSPATFRTCCPGLQERWLSATHPAVTTTQFDAICTVPRPSVVVCQCIMVLWCAHHAVSCQVAYQWLTARARVCRYYMFFCVAAGLWGGMVIGVATEYYTSNTYQPVRDVADACRTGAATNIIFGLALGYLSCIIPVFCIAICIFTGAPRCLPFTSMFLFFLCASATAGLLCKRLRERWHCLLGVNI